MTGKLWRKIQKDLSVSFTNENMKKLLGYHHVKGIFSGTENMIQQWTSVPIMADKSITGSDDWDVEL